ncbi:MAG: 3-deoxy-D-manno-octulosonic acid transferase [Nitrospiraceae bacterium]|nr:3-deoxy-D-manno-octulosonic acid transferase [Nitrospiraceae bacterium]
MKRPKGARMAWLAQKFGRMGKEIFQARREGGSAVWVHAVSVGEVMAAVPFIEALRARGLEPVISTITETGRQVARKKFPEGRIIYLPFDLPFAFKRAAREVKPRAFILMETELWPNAVRTMHGLGIPVFIVNGRLSEKSTAGYRRFHFFFKRVVSKLSLICVQDEVYAKRAALIGAPEQKILVTGNFKFEMGAKGPSLAPAWPVWMEKLTRPVIVAGSTHAGEEEFLIEIYKKLKMEFPLLSLVLVPRHPERAPEVGALIKKAGMNYIKSSMPGVEEARGETMVDAGQPGIVLVDTVGELFNIYSKADVAVVGGSFIPRGGQNPLEPAYWGKPVICGPDMRNFTFMPEFLESGGALTADKETLLEKLAGLLADEGRRTAMGADAKKFHLERSGAVGKTANAIMAVLG